MPIKLTNCKIAARSVGGKLFTCSGVRLSTCISMAYEDHKVSPCHQTIQKMTNSLSGIHFRGSLSWRRLRCSRLRCGRLSVIWRSVHSLGRRLVIYVGRISGGAHWGRYCWLRCVDRAALRREWRLDMGRWVWIRIRVCVGNLAASCCNHTLMRICKPPGMEKINV